jgi:DNA-binding GntR family transcriptional regulator
MVTVVGAPTYGRLSHTTRVYHPVYRNVLGGALLVTTRFVLVRVFDERYGWRTVPPPAAARRRSTTRALKATRHAPAETDGRLDSISRVYQELRSLIVWGQLPPGARIAERAVAERLGVSRTPVRSALHRLQQEGFVSSIGSGREQRLIISPVTGNDGREVFIVVGHLEGLAARLAASLPAARRREIARDMRERNREMASESRRGGDAARIFLLDLEFHRTYIEGVVGPRLLGLHEAIKPQCERYARFYISVLMDELSTSVKEHEKIAAAIAAGDPDRAQRAAETNWHNAAARLTRIINLHGERGSWHAWSPDVPSPSQRARRSR